MLLAPPVCCADASVASECEVDGVPAIAGRTNGPIKSSKRFHAHYRVFDLPKHTFEYAAAIHLSGKLVSKGIRVRNEAVDEFLPDHLLDDILVVVVAESSR